MQKYCFGLICILSLLVLASMLRVERSLPHAKTVSRLKHAYATVRFLERTNEAPITSQIAQAHKGRDLQIAWECLLGQNASVLHSDSESLKRDLCYDAWGKRFNVELRSALSKIGRAHV